jgi:hypothetical protein
VSVAVAMRVLTLTSLCVFAATQTAEEDPSGSAEAGEYYVADKGAGASAEEGVAVFVFAALGAVEVPGLVTVMAATARAGRVGAVGVGV